MAAKNKLEFYSTEGKFADPQDVIYAFPVVRKRIKEKEGDLLSSEVRREAVAVWSFRRSGDPEDLYSKDSIPRQFSK